MADTRRLGDILIEEAIVSREAVAAAMDLQRSGTEHRLGELLCDAGALDPAWLTAALAEQAGLDTLDPLTLGVDPPMLWRVPPEVAERLGAFVGRDEEGPIVVLADPSNHNTPRQIANLLGIPSIRAAAGLRERVSAAITRHYDTAPARARRVRGVVGEERPATTSVTGQQLDQGQMSTRLTRGGLRAYPDFATALLVYAEETGAERLEFDAGRVRLTHDGVDAEVLHVPEAHAAGVAAALRARVRLDGTASRTTGGEAKIPVGDSTLSVRVRASGGELGGRVDIHFLRDSPAAELPLVPKAAAAWRELAATAGLVVIAVSENADGQPFIDAAARADVRTLTDWASAESAVKAAEAGRVVFVRLAAAGIPEALARLNDLAPNRAAAAAVLRGAVTQRRLRRVCSTCALPPDQSPVVADRLGVLPFAAPRAGHGCPACGYRGYTGSAMAFEVVVAERPLREAFGAGATAAAFGALALPVAERTLQVDAVALAIGGVTSAEELLRVIPPPAEWAARSREDRHRGLFRAITAEPVAAPPPPPAAPEGEELPVVFVVHPNDSAVSQLRAALRGRAAVVGARSAAAARSMSHPELPVVGIVAQWAAGGWDPELLREWLSCGTRVVLMGPPNDLAQMETAFSLGAEDYAASLDEVAVRLARWLPFREVPDLRLQAW